MKIDADELKKWIEDNTWDLAEDLALHVAAADLKQKIDEMVEAEQKKQEGK